MALGPFDGLRVNRKEGYQNAPPQEAEPGKSSANAHAVEEQGFHNRFSITLCPQNYNSTTRINDKGRERLQENDGRVAAARAIILRLRSGCGQAHFELGLVTLRAFAG